MAELDHALVAFSSV